MYCPVCGKQQISDQTRFCSGCGFPLTGLAEFIAGGGTPVKNKKPDSPRKRGIKQGAMIFLIGCFLIVPLTAIMIPAFHISPFFVPFAAILSFMGGILRIIYAFMFESNVSVASPDSFDSNYAEQPLLNYPATAPALPPQTSIPVSDFQMPAPGSWRDSADLVPNSVTENTTKLLEKEK